MGRPRSDTPPGLFSVIFPPASCRWWSAANSGAAATVLRPRWPRFPVAGGQPFVNDFSFSSDTSWVWPSSDSWASDWTGPTPFAIQLFTTIVPV